MKYESTTKIDRNKAIYEFHLRHPEFTIRDLARLFRMKYQRIGQLCNPKEKHYWREDGQTESA